jgi:hypothetical protein
MASASRLVRQVREGNVETALKCLYAISCSQSVIAPYTRRIVDAAPACTSPTVALSSWAHRPTCSSIIFRKLRRHRTNNFFSNEREVVEKDSIPRDFGLAPSSSLPGSTGARRPGKTLWEDYACH